MFVFRVQKDFRLPAVSSFTLRVSLQVMPPTSEAHGVYYRGSSDNSKPQASK